MTNSDRCKLALVGCGNIAQAHWTGIQNHAPDIDVTAVVDTSPQRANDMAELTGAEPFTSLNDALAGADFNAVDLMVPHDLHVQIAVEAFAAGKHVLLEKPMAPDLRGCEEIMAAAEKAGTVFMIAEQSQYWPDIHEAVELIAAGRIGSLISARANFIDILRPDPDDPVPWRFKLEKSGGGICIDGGAHWIRPLRMLLGEIDEVIAVTGHHVETMEGESMAHAIFRFESGITATFDALLTDGRIGPGESFRITGKAGEILIEHGRNGRLMLFTEDYPEGEVVQETFAGKMDSFGLELQDFSQAILEGTPLQATAEYSLGELRAALAIYRSVESRTWEKVWDQV